MKSAQSDTVLEAANMAQMVGVLQQLGWLATYSHELFTGLTIEAEGSLTRINQLKGRLGRVTERLARVDDALAAAGESELADICAANPGGEYKLTHEQVSGLFTPNSRPPALQATFDEAKEPPPLYLLDQFASMVRCDPGLQQPMRPTHRSRSPPACSGLPLQAREERPRIHRCWDAGKRLLDGVRSGARRMPPAWLSLPVQVCAARPERQQVPQVRPGGDLPRPLLGPELLPQAGEPQP